MDEKVSERRQHLDASREAWRTAAQQFAANKDVTSEDAFRRAEAQLRAAELAAKAAIARRDAVLATIEVDVARSR